MSLVVSTRLPDPQTGPLRRGVAPRTNDGCFFLSVSVRLGGGFESVVCISALPTLCASSREQSSRCASLALSKFFRYFIFSRQSGLAEKRSHAVRPRRLVPRGRTVQLTHSQRRVRRARSASDRPLGERSNPAASGAMGLSLSVKARQLSAARAVVGPVPAVARRPPVVLAVPVVMAPLVGADRFLGPPGAWWCLVQGRCPVRTQYVAKSTFTPAISPFAQTR